LGVNLTGRLDVSSIPAVLEGPLLPVYCLAPEKRSTIMRKSWFAILVAATALFSADRSFDTWNEYLGGADSSQYSALKQINKSNVKQLQIAWRYPAGGNSLFFDPHFCRNNIGSEIPRL
jgi:hypothetical protein